MTDSLLAADRRNLLAVRARLWQDRAAVLVGAGMSRAASLPLHSQATPLPLWSDLSRAMAESLYVNGETLPPPLRLAQEYETAFGSQALTDLVLAHVADQEHAPGPLYHALLRLPWADMFTTNYDTLLERASQGIPNRYDPVFLPSDLARQRAPRIVKLHGSLPSHHPFVLTEEHFRTYAHTHAPFVSLVQTTLAEHAVVLLGFSYDDPNFLAWSGWARDHLGPQAPPIHLVGALDLPAHRRQLLDERGVRPVDIGSLFPRSNWPDPDARHHAALTWILASLANGQPDDPLDWPEPSRKSSFLQVPPGVPSPLPAEGQQRKPAPTYPGPAIRPANAASEPPDLVKLRDDWCAERLSYPGWIVAPLHIQKSVARSVIGWGNKIEEHATSLTPGFRLSLLREYAWRHRISGLLLSNKEVSLAIDTLNAVNPAPHILSLPESTASASETPLEGTPAALLDDWIHLAASVLETTRRSLDRLTFETWSRHLSQLPLKGEVLDRTRYESCRLALAELDRDAALASLAAWTDTPGSFPFGTTWRASIQGELGQWTDALATATKALARIHTAQSASRVPSVALLSQEGWTRQLVAYAEQVVAHDSRDYSKMHQVDFSWQRELTRYGANPADVLSRVESEVSVLPQKKTQPILRRRSFDRGTHRTTRNLFVPSFDSSLIEAGQRALSMIEEGGLVHTPAPSFVISDLSTGGAAWTQIVNPFYALSVHLQTGTDALFSVFSRTRIGALSEDVIGRIHDWIWTGIRTGVADLSDITPEGWSHPATKRLAPLLELLSRLAFRLDDDNREAIAQLGLDLAAIPAVQRDYQLYDAVGNLVRRGLRYLSSEREGPVALAALSTPLPGVDFQPTSGRAWPSFGRILGHSEPPGSIAKPQEALTDRLTSALTREGIPRIEAFWRLYALFKAGVLSTNVAEFFLQHVCDGEDSLGQASNGIPPSKLLELPGEAGKQVCAHLRTLAVSKPEDMDLPTFWRLAFSSAAPDQPGDIGVSWTLSEVMNMLAGVEAWIESISPGGDDGDRFYSPLSNARDYPHPASLLGRGIMPAIPIDDHSTWNRISSAIGSLQELGIPTGRALHFLLYQEDKPAEVVASLFRAELGSSNRERFMAAMWGISSWCVWAEQGHPKPPADLAESVIHAMSRGDDRSSVAAMALSHWLLNSSRLAIDLADRIGSALLGLLSHVSLPSPDDALQLPPPEIDDEIDSIAEAGARLASNLAPFVGKSGDGANAVHEWRKYSLASPFPDVRNAFSDDADPVPD